MGKSPCCNFLFKIVKRGLHDVMGRYGEFVGRYPWQVIALNIAVFGGLGLGILTMKVENDIEKVYLPRDSQASQDRQWVRNTFPDINAFAYNPFSQSEIDKVTSIIFRAKSKTIFVPEVINEINLIITQIKSLTSDVSHKNFSQLCAKVASHCVVDGEFVLGPHFVKALEAGQVTYPIWNSLFLSTSLSGARVNVLGVLQSATVLRASFMLRDPDKGWLEAFLTFCHDLRPNHTEIVYSTPDSLYEELDKSSRGDAGLFVLTLMLVSAYACMVSSGGNAVSTRAPLAFAGLLAAGLGIIGSMGLLCLCGVPYISIIGVLPFLIIGIGVDDMFLMMASWSQSLPSNVEEQTVENVPKILGKTMSNAGVGITITSLTDFLAFCIGSLSVFPSVTHFSLYAGVAVMFCYIANASLFGACLAIHGRRVYSQTNCFTCQKVKPREERMARGYCYECFCGGQHPEGPGNDESIFELVPRRLFPHLFKHTAMNIVIVALFMGYLGIAIYGSTELKQGISFEHLVLKKSYYYQYILISEEFFPISVPVAFIVTEKIDYTGNTQNVFNELFLKAHKDKDMNPFFVRCWLNSYTHSSFYNASDPKEFVSNLRVFLGQSMDFIADVVFDNTNTSIIASRCFVQTKPNSDHYVKADIMQRMRKLADDFPLPLMAFHPTFVTFEQYLLVWPATLQLLVMAVCAMTVVTFAFLPQPLMVLLVVVTIVMILVGIFGFMHLWDLTLSSITMIHLVMSVGFSVDFSSHVCSSYMMSHSIMSQDRATDAINHAAAAIFNGAASTLLGVIPLAVSDSYLFQSFLKVMVLVIGLGLIHAVYFLPAILSLIGPDNEAHEEDITVESVEPVELVEPVEPVIFNPENDVGLDYGTSV